MGSQVMHNICVCRTVIGETFGSKYFFEGLVINYMIKQPETSDKMDQQPNLHSISKVSFFWTLSIMIKRLIYLQKYNFYVSLITPTLIKAPKKGTFNLHDYNKTKIKWTLMYQHLKLHQNSRTDLTLLMFIGTKLQNLYEITL